MSRDTHSVDPDAQATVNDFMDYTEYLHADVIRSLKLLQKLDEQYNATTQEIHDLLIQYNELQGDESDAQEAQELRAKISYKLDLTISRRGSSYAEATRLYDEVERQLKRINSVRMKLSALPLPPSRDPTPAGSPANKANRNRGNERSARISLKYDALKGSLPFSPLEVDPYEAIGSPMFSDNEHEWERMSSPVTPGASRKKSVFKSPKREKTPKQKLPKLPGHVGTNVHSAVAGISTSNALSLLTPPPDDVKPGSKWAPWFRLTEYEMALLRKKMKKNAIWSPSDTMIRRELSAGQRGAEYYPRARTQAHERGTTIEDFDDTPNQHKRALLPGEIRADFVKMGIPRDLPAPATTSTPAPPTTISIKKERKSTASKEPSKLSTPIPAITDVTRNFELIREGLNSKLKESSPSSTRPPASSKKRKIEAMDTPITAEEPASAIKKAKTVGAKDVKGGKSTANLSAAPHQLIDILAAEIPARTPSRKGSSTPILKQPETTTQVPDVATLDISERAMPTTRRKRAPPGQVTAPIEGGSAILVSKSRTRAPRKAMNTPASVAAEKIASESGKQSDRERATKIEEEQAGDMEVDGEDEVGEDEERYCFCGDVSFGTMIACENDDCARSWFHLDCVGLKEPPGRREKWWCSACRKQLGMGTPAGGKK